MSVRKPKEATVNKATGTVKKGSSKGSNNKNSPLRLTPNEAELLTVHEQTIGSGLASFEAVGASLMKIRDNLLYKAKFPTFEKYCVGRWNMSSAHAYRLIDAARCMAALRKRFSPIGEKLPSNEAQVRPVASLPDSKWIKAWKHVLAKLGKRDMTAERVTEIIGEFAGKTATSKKPLAKSVKKTPSALAYVVYNAKKALKRKKGATIVYYKGVLRKILERVEAAIVS